MRQLKLINSWVKKISTLIQDILVPEDLRIQKLLTLPPEDFRNLIPQSPVFMNNILVLFDYQNKIVRLIVKAIKYKNNRGLRQRIAQYLYEELAEIASDITLFEGAPPILVPMPMSQKERKDRGFNQTEELVREIKKLDGGNLFEVSFDLLKKTRETERQTKLTRERRAENVRDSMCAFSGSEATMKTPHPERSEGERFLKNRVVIVLDDVYTTGASFSEAERALLSSGAKRVIGLFVAH